MKKYQEALVIVKEALQAIPPPGEKEVMKNYLRELNTQKLYLLNNLSISITSVKINEQIDPDKKPLNNCLIDLAKNSLTILCVLKKTDSETILTNNATLFEKKNADYGNSFVDFALIGIIVRLNDKINRILNLGGAPSANMQVDEKIEDTINDLYNYCIIGLMYT